MRRGLLASLVLLGAVSLAQADYVVIIANLNPKQETKGGALGALGGGAMGFPAGGGMANRGGLPAAGGMANRGGFPAGGAMAGGFPAGGAMAGGLPAAGGMANRGGFPAAGGMANRGGFPAGGGFPGMGGVPGVAPPVNPEAADESANLVVAILEVTPPGASYRKSFKLGMPKKFTHRFGGHATLFHKAPQYEAHILETPDGQVLKSRSVVFKDMHDKLLKEKATAEEMLKLARWALEHGLVDDFVKVMDKLAETEKTNTAVAAYVKIKADLAKPLAKEDLSEKWKAKLLDGYRLTQTDEHHYALLHGGDMGAGVKTQLDLLENSLRSYFYWWALRGITMPVPKERLLAVFTDKGDDFSKLRKNLTSSPPVADSFFARREVLSVFAGKRGDRPYNTLEGMTQAELWSKGYIKDKLVKNEPRGYPRTLRADQVHGQRAWALVQTAMEHEWELNNTSHEASRQLLYATGLLPHNVNAPEWIQFGMGSFFEAPLQSPWSGVGALSAYWLPRFKEGMAKKKYGDSARDTLTKVITDGYFRSLPPLPDKATQAQREARSIEQRRARAAAWALTYYLAQMQLDGLRRYFKELSRMPRDVELDDKVLVAAFAKAFDCVDANKKVDQGKLAALATRWVNYMNGQTLEAEAVHKKIREFYEKVAKQAKPPAGGGLPGMNPGGNPGIPPVGPGGRPGVPPAGGGGFPKPPGGN